MDKCICAAKVIDPMQRENLCQCVSILGATATCSGETVLVEYEGDNATKLVELFEHYTGHEIRFHRKEG